MVLNLFKLASLRGLLAVFFLMLSFSTSSIATVYKYGTNYTATFYTVDEACEYDYTRRMQTSQSNYITSYDITYGSIGSFWSSPNKYQTSHKCNYYQSSGSYGTSGIWAYSYPSCDAGYTDDGSGNCIVEPQCPAGTINLGTTENPDCASYCNTGATTTFIFDLYDIPTGGWDGQGCEYTNTGNVYSESCYEKGSDYFCPVVFQKTGNHDGTGTSEGDSDQFYPVGSEDTNNYVDESDQYAPPAQTSSIDYEKTPEVITNQQDGTVTTEYTESETHTQDSGTLIKTWNGNIYKTDSTGQIVEVVSQHTINSYTDGTGDETIVETIKKIPSTIDEWSKNLTTGEVAQIQYQDGESGTKSKTVTLTYGSDGSVIGTNVSSEGHTLDNSCFGDCGDGDGDGQGGEYIPTDKQGSFDEAIADAKARVTQAKADFSTQFQSMKSEASSLLSFDFGGGAGALPCPPPINLNLGAYSPTFDLCLTDYENQLNIIAIIILFLAAILAAVIILR